LTFLNNTLRKVSNIAKVVAIVKPVMAKEIMAKLRMSTNLKQVIMVDKEVWGTRRKLAQSSIIMARLLLLLVLD